MFLSIFCQIIFAVYFIITQWNKQSGNHKKKSPFCFTWHYLTDYLFYVVTAYNNLVKNTEYQVAHGFWQNTEEGAFKRPHSEWFKWKPISSIKYLLRFDEIAVLKANFKGESREPATRAFNLMHSFPWFGYVMKEVLKSQLELQKYCIPKIPNHYLCTCLFR